MPNTGHRWTEDEDRAALVAWPHYDVFCIIIGSDRISYHGFRHRVRALRARAADQQVQTTTGWRNVVARVRRWFA